MDKKPWREGTSFSGSKSLSWDVMLVTPLLCFFSMSPALVLFTRSDMPGREDLPTLLVTPPILSSACSGWDGRRGACENADGVLIRASAPHLGQVHVRGSTVTTEDHSCSNVWTTGPCLSCPCAGSTIRLVCASDRQTTSNGGKLTHPREADLSLSLSRSPVMVCKASNTTVGSCHH